MRLWKRLPRWLKRLFKALAALLTLTLLIAAGLWWYLHPNITRTDGIVYGQRHGEELTMDVLQPKRPNGRAVAVMVSGGWRSSGPGSLDTWLIAPFLRGGVMVFWRCS